MEKMNRRQILKGMVGAASVVGIESLAGNEAEAREKKKNNHPERLTEKQAIDRKLQELQKVRDDFSNMRKAQEALNPIQAILKEQLSTGSGNFPSMNEAMRYQQLLKDTEEMYKKCEGNYKAILDTANLPFKQDPQLEKFNATIHHYLEDAHSYEALNIALSEDPAHAIFLDRLEGRHAI